MNQMLTAKDVQELLQVDRSTVYRMAEDGRLPAIKVGRQWRFAGPQIQSWLAANKSPASMVQTAVTTTPPLAAQLPIECVQLIQDTYAQALGVMIIITDMQGTPVTHLSNPCGLFDALSDVPQLWQKCVAHWREMAAGLSLEPQFAPGYLGLLCARAFIRLDTQLKGQVFIGGIAPDDWAQVRGALPDLAPELQVSPALIAAHATEVYFLDTAQKQHVLSLIQPIADVISHILHERNQMMLATS